MSEHFDAIKWHGQKLLLLDQRALPFQIAYLEFENAMDVAKAITDMVVRGAPAIGITAAYAVVLAARARYRESSNAWREAITADIDVLRKARPTAVNLAWALDRMATVVAAISPGIDPEAELLQEAQRIHQEDIDANKRMGELGADVLARDPVLIEPGRKHRIITHCNAGALATGGFGTALGVIRAAHARHMVEHVYADETRPWLQGARLTAWELQQDDIPVSLLIDSAAAQLMQREGITWVIVGSDRITANGDVVNKIGTYQLAVSAKYHGVKVMVAAPTSTVDMDLLSGEQVVIENRDTREVTHVADRAIATPGVEVLNPAFDVTPAQLVDAIVTEKGVVEKPDRKKMAAMMKNAG